MDFALADDITMQKMLEEYSKHLPGQARLLSYISDEENPSRTLYQSFCFALPFLLLYIISDLRYNTRYGTQIFDTDRSMGRLQCNGSSFRSINNLR